MRTRALVGDQVDDDDDDGVNNGDDDGVKFPAVLESRVRWCNADRSKGGRIANSWALECRFLRSGVALTQLDYLPLNYLPKYRNPRLPNMSIDCLYRNCGFVFEIGRRIKNFILL